MNRKKSFLTNSWREDNNIDLLINGEQFFPRVFNAIHNAKFEVIIETFIIFEDKVGLQLKQTLIDAARRGVKVHLTADGYGTWELQDEYIAELVSAGVRFNIFDPQPRFLSLRVNLFRRIHRKIVVVDRERAFVGGINYSDDHNSSFGPEAKQDYALEITGPVVADIYKSTINLLLRASSLASRKEYINHTLPGLNKAGESTALFVERDNWQHKSDIEYQYRLAVRAAKTRIIIANAYFFPGLRFLRELRDAARRGVEVNLILQGRPDMPWVTALSRLLYSYLLRSGVNITEYCKKPLHGKVAVIDDEWVTVGSSNLDPLSLSLNLEANVFVKDKVLNKKLSDHLIKMKNAFCKETDVAVAEKGYWWRTPLIFISFHFLRYFPRVFGWLPAHSPTLKSFTLLKNKTNNPPIKNEAEVPKLQKLTGEVYYTEKVMDYQKDTVK